MADNRFQTCDGFAGGNFKEAVCIDTGRIYDSCSDKDCLEDLRVYFTECNQRIVDQAVSVRSRRADVITVYIDIEPVPFNKGFYSVDMTFFFDVVVDVYASPAAHPCTIDGLAVFNKKVILYGSEGAVKVFASDFRCNEDDDQYRMSGNLPKAVCQVADPIILSARICVPCACRGVCDCFNEVCVIPDCFSRRFGGPLGGCRPEKVIYVTIGVFTIVQLERNVQMLIPVYDFCVPDKEGREWVSQTGRAYPRRLPHKMK